VLTLPESAGDRRKPTAYAREIGVALRRCRNVRDYQVWMGRSGIIDFNGMLRGNADQRGENYAEIRVNLSRQARARRNRMTSCGRCGPQLQAIVARVPGAGVQLVEDPPGPPVRGNIHAEIYGRDVAQMRLASDCRGERRSHTRNVVEVTDTEPADVPRFRFVIDREKAALSGVTAADITTALRRLVDGETLGRAHGTAN
jgi:multidrug efflux pump subunit AcrB